MKCVDLKEFKKYITKNWGKRCKEYVFGCYVCMAWRCYDDLESLIFLSEDYEEEQKSKIKKPSR